MIHIKVLWEFGSREKAKEWKLVPWMWERPAELRGQRCQEPDKLAVEIATGRSAKYALHHERQIESVFQRQLIGRRRCVKHSSRPI